MTENTWYRQYNTASENPKDSDKFFKCNQKVTMACYSIVISVKRQSDGNTGMQRLSGQSDFCQAVRPPNIPFSTATKIKIIDTGKSFKNILALQMAAAMVMSIIPIGVMAVQPGKEDDFQ